MQRNPPLAEDAMEILQNNSNFMKHQHRLGPSIDVASESKNPTNSSNNESTQFATANNNHSKTAKSASDTLVVIQQPSPAANNGPKKAR